MTNKEKIEILLKEKKQLRKLYHQPNMRRMNGKPTSEAFDLYGKRIYEIEAEIYKLIKS